MPHVAAEDGTRLSYEETGAFNRALLSFFHAVEQERWGTAALRP